MQFLGLEQNLTTAKQVAEYMVRWASFSHTTKREILHERHRVSSILNGIGGRGRTYLLPMCTLVNADEDANGDGSVDAAAPAEEEGPIMVCKNGLQGLLCIGRKLWTSSIKNPGQVHGNTGKANKSKPFAEVYVSLTTFFEALEKEGSPFATRIIREETGTTMRDDDPNEVCLPPHITKHKCYARWCWERGWKVFKVSRTLTLYDKVQNFSLHENDDASAVPLWPSGSTPERVVTWPTFLDFWKENFPHIKLRKKGADTCTDCLVLVNEFRMRLGASARNENEDDSSQEEGAGGGVNGGDGDDDGGNGDGGGGGGGSDGGGGDEDMLVRQMNNAQLVLQKAKAHVKKYQVQRRHATHVKDLAKLDITNHLPSLFRRRVLTIDMGQNLSVPNFEGEQPGDTYYLSPLTVYLFGVVEAEFDSEKGLHDQMNAYLWPEYEGDRGANNICSCLKKDFQKRGFFNSPNFGELTIVADNCGGQNKNKIVVRFLMWMVETGIFPKVTLLFLVKGHTKNACDRLFNLVKLDYHRRNTYSYDELMESVNSNSDVDAMKMEKGDMRNYLEWQDKYYRTPKPGGFNQTHIFTIEGNQNGGVPTRMLMNDNHGSERRIDILLPTKRNKKAAYIADPAERKSKIANMLDELNVLDAPGLRPIKQVELYTKWRPLLPPHAAAVTCPKPTDEVLNMVRDEKKSKAAAKRVAKKPKKRKAQEDSEIEGVPM